MEKELPWLLLPVRIVAPPVYLPTREEIEAAKAELDTKRLAAFDASQDGKSITEEERREAARLRSRLNCAAAKAALELEDTNLELLQDDQSEPLDLDEHRDPRQTEQWLPVPAVEPEPEANDWATRLERHRRELIQTSWDSRREQRELAADADRRGVLNYYNINRGPRMPYHDRANDEQFDMADRDIANVELLEFGQVDETLGMVIDAVESQHEMEDLNCRWAIVEPTRRKEPRDVVAFRSKRK